jgi:hypothetical protein
MRHQKNETSIRSLQRLYKAGSTVRVLNNIKVYNERNTADSETQKKITPIFENKYLNNSFILKHKMRAHELELFPELENVVTKIIVPIDIANLSSGGRFVFMGQESWHDILESEIGVNMSGGNRDLKILQVLNAIPSFDPFILREALAREGIFPDEAYFMLSAADMLGMEGFVFNEVSQLVAISMGQGAQQDTTLRLVRKILSATYDNDLEPLREVLRLTPDTFREAMFCWKGFLYYKWSTKSMEAKIKSTLTEMKNHAPSKSQLPEEHAYCETTRKKIGIEMVMLYNSVADSIVQYDKSYRQLVRAQNPGAFREFLLTASTRFLEMGERLGVLTHILQFWQYRSTQKRMIKIPPRELCDIMRDFQSSILTVADMSTVQPQSQASARYG